MPNEHVPAGSRAPLHGRVAAWLRDEAGDTMIEVMVAAVLVALIAVATFTGYSSVAHVASGETTRAQASSLAEADQARLHGLTLNNLSSSGSGLGVGNTSYTQTVDNTVYTIASSTKFVSGSGAASCTSSGTTTADEVQTTSMVTWNNDGYAGGPVEIHGLVTPPQGGSLIVRVLNSSGVGISGASVALSGGPTSVSPLTTDANGCVEFGGLSGGSYTATATQGSTSTNGSATVVATQTKTITLTPAGGTGAISATFTTTYNGSSHASTADQVTAWLPSNGSVYPVFGTASSLYNNTYQSTVSSGAQFAPGTYTTYAGTCSGDYSGSGYALANVTAGTTQSVSLPLPAMIVDVWGAGAPVETDDAPSSSVVYTGSGWTHSTTQTGNYDNTESWSQTAGNYVKYTFTGTSIEWIGPKWSNQGYANVLIDGNQVGTDVNTYSSANADQQVLFADSGLTNTTHTIEIYVVGGTAPPGSSASYVPIDEFISGTGTSSEVDDANSAVTYSGTFTHATGFSSDYDGTESWSNTTGNYTSFTFTGTSVEWITSMASNHGYANIYLDGTLVQSNVDTYAPSSVNQQAEYTVSGLSNGSHTLTIYVDGTKDANSGGAYVTTDAFVYGTESTGLLTSAPVVTLTDNNAACNSNENYPATQVPTLTQGALADPGQPYGNWTVCASSGGEKNTATVANTSYTTGNVVNVYLGSGSSGLTSGSCT
jgi:Tfp pilus assembly protein PilE